MQPLFKQPSRTIHSIDSQPVSALQKNIQTPSPEITPTDSPEAHLDKIKELEEEQDDVYATDRALQGYKLLKLTGPKHALHKHLETGNIPFNPPPDLSVRF